MFSLQIFRFLIGFFCVGSFCSFLFFSLYPSSFGCVFFLGLSCVLFCFVFIVLVFTIHSFCWFSQSLRLYGLVNASVLSILDSMQWRWHFAFPFAFPFDRIKQKNKDMFVELCSSDSIFLLLGCHFRSTNYFAWTQRTVLSKRFFETKVQCQWLKDKCTHWIFKMNWMTAYFDFILILLFHFNQAKWRRKKKTQN